MKRGEEARAKVYENIKEAFGENFVGVFDKKIYVWAEEGAEKIHTIEHTKIIAVKDGQSGTE